MNNLVLIGAGGHALSVIDCVDKDEFSIAGFIDIDKTGEYYGIPILSDDVVSIPGYQNYVYFVSVGNNEVRKKCFNELKELGLNTVNIVDKSAIVSETAKLGTANFIGKNAVINAYAEIGDNNIINTKALVEHGCKVGSHTHLSTNAVINGEVIVNDSAFIGSGAVVICQKEIGQNSIVGAGSVVINDVEPSVTVAGVPATIRSKKHAES